jgi:hypothetical protein
MLAGKHGLHSAADHIVTAAAKSTVAKHDLHRAAKGHAKGVAILRQSFQKRDGCGQVKRSAILHTEVGAKLTLPKTAFLMIVTPRDFPIATYTIPALARVTESSSCVHAVIYCNGLSAHQIKRIARLLNGYSRIDLKDNSAYLLSIRDTLKVGNFVTASGHVEERQGVYETAPEIWSRELVSLDADFVTIIDPDFEIFDSLFLWKMLEEIENQPQIGFYSTDYMPQHKTFETYSQQEAILAERWDTWFCIYRRTALEKYHDFTYREHTHGGLVTKYDHSATLQQVLIKSHGYAGRSLSNSYSNQFLHYGNFAQNRSLRGMTLKFYRVARIGRHNGWLHKHRSKLLARIFRKLAAAAWVTCRMDRFDAERRRWAHEMEPVVDFVSQRISESGDG